jgi:glucose/mannose-6-phosphate isomerase
VIVYSGSGASAAAAVRWRQQLNENAKMPGHSAAVPELQHNEICSWQHGGAAQSRLSVVMLRDGDDSPQERARLDLTSEIVTRAGGRVHEISAEGENRLARIARLVQIGDWLSFYLALLEGVDPTDISVLVEIKRRLADSRTAGS